MAHYKENPKNSLISIRVTKQEKEDLQKLADLHCGGRLSDLFRQLAQEYLKKEKLNYD